MKIADLRIQTSTPDSPGAGVVGLYANSSGIPVIINSAGTVTQVGEKWIADVSTASKISTGVPFGAGTAAVYPILSGIYIPISVSGVNYAIPAFKYS